MSLHTQRSRNVTKEAGLGFMEDRTTGYQYSVSGAWDFYSGGVLSGQQNALGQLQPAIMLGPNVTAVSPAQGAATQLYIWSKSVLAILDGAATTVLNFTIPNPAVGVPASAMFRVDLLSVLGLGGAIDAGEAVIGMSYNVGVTRTNGLTAVATAGTIYGSAAAHVAGAATATSTAAVAAVTGGATVTQTLPFQVTITAGSGSSTNHRCLVVVSLLNLNASGISVS